MRACTQCGRCCQLYADGGLSASTDEVAFWQEHRPDIAQYVRDGEIWFDPHNGERLPRCPFLESQTEMSGEQEVRTFSCAIYEHRPDDCRHYPVNITDMQRDGCEMLELRDLDNPRRAQRQLDALMFDSRPSSVT